MIIKAILQNPKPKFYVYAEEWIKINSLSKFIKLYKIETLPQNKKNTSMWPSLTEIITDGLFFPPWFKIVPEH